MGFDDLLADRTKSMDVNVIREILKVVSQPGMVSLAGGIPAPESFPMQIMRDLTSTVIDKYEYIAGGYLAKHLPRIINLYRPKQEAMLAALDNYFPDRFRWSRPEGGMFIWAEGPPGLDMQTLYWKAVEKKVAFVPGKYFYATPGEGIETMRLNFTMADEQTIDRSIKTLAEVIEDFF